ncbi:MAG: hypothetical protein GXP48_09865 [Acidobacteria bacterium]|nr:hypothetical protein [Acidobacteriota bacterium]
MTAGMTGAHSPPPCLFLEIDHETVTGVEGHARDLVPPLITDVVGAGLLDFVHPVDRSAIATWLTEGLGASPPFRRAAADDPPRWFRFITADIGPGGKRGRILFVDVTLEVRQEALRQRLNSVLARYVGWSLVQRAPELAAELSGASYGCLTELYPPLAIVRAAYGQGMPEAGTTLPIHGTPLEDAAGSRTMKVLREGVGELYPSWPLVRLVRAESAIIIPIVDPATAETRAVLTCCSARPLDVTPVEEELLDLLAMRLSSELGARDGAQGHDPPPLGSAVNVPDDVVGGLMTMMMFDGVIHTLNNLFASQMLHLDLVTGDLPSGGAVARRLERVAAEAARGANIVEGLGLLAHGGSGQWRDVELDRVVRRALELVRTIHGAVDMTLDGGAGVGLRLWVEERTLVRLLAGLLEACATMAGEAGKVRIGVWQDTGDNGEKQWAVVRMTAGMGTPGSESADVAARATERLNVGLVVARRFAGRFGGRVAFSRDGQTATIEIAVPAFPADGRPPDGGDPGHEKG